MKPDIQGILLIVIDCLRADRISAAGYHRPTTPTIDRLAAEGVLWEQAYGVSSWTRPSVTTMLTGLYPSEHGAFEGIKRSRGKTTVTTDVLRSGEPTLAEVLAARGWRCGAFLNNAQLGPFTRLDRGFEVYESSAGKADRIIEMFRRWLDDGRSAPRFAYLHFLEAHWPYKPRRRHVKAFGGDRDTNMFRDYRARDYARLGKALSRQERVLRDTESEQLIQMYDGAVRRLDGKLKTLLGVLESAGVLDSCAVVVTADHGEAFAEHGRIGHGHSLHEELIRVPLVVRLPGVASPVRRTEPVSHVDLAKTLLTITGCDEGLPGVDLLSPAGVPRPVIAELRIKNRYTQSIRCGDWKFIRRFRFGNDRDAVPEFADPRSLLDSEAWNKTTELYDLVADPAEQANLGDCSDHTATHDQMERALDAWWSACRSSSHAGAAEVELDDRTVQRLRDLGYLD